MKQIICSQGGQNNDYRHTSQYIMKKMFCNPHYFNVRKVFSIQTMYLGVEINDIFHQHGNQLCSVHSLRITSIPYSEYKTVNVTIHLTKETKLRRAYWIIRITVHSKSLCTLPDTRT